MNDTKLEWYLLQFEAIFNKKTLKRLRSIKGSREDEAALSTIRWSEGDKAIWQAKPRNLAVGERKDA